MKFALAPDVPIPIFASTSCWTRISSAWRRAARWTGGIANQNRGTLGGNIVNASPAADSLAALLVYEAELDSGLGAGRAPGALRNFHTGYKKTQLAPDELIRAICLPRRFSEYVQPCAQSRSPQCAGDFQSMHRGSGPHCGLEWSRMFASLWEAWRRFRFV